MKTWIVSVAMLAGLAVAGERDHQSFVYQGQRGRQSMELRTEVSRRDFSQVRAHVEFNFEDSRFSTANILMMADLEGDQLSLRAEDRSERRLVVIGRPEMSRQVSGPVLELERRERVQLYDAFNYFAPIYYDMRPLYQRFGELAVDFPPYETLDDLGMRVTITDRFGNLFCDQFVPLGMQRWDGGRLSLSLSQLLGFNYSRLIGHELLLRTHVFRSSRGNMLNADQFRAWDRLQGFRFILH